MMRFVDLDFYTDYVCTGYRINFLGNRLSVAYVYPCPGCDYEDFVITQPFFGKFLYAHSYTVPQMGHCCYTVRVSQG
jgi:hypothetical protein